MSRGRLLAIACPLFVIASAVGAEAAPRTYICHRASRGITIDGALDDPGWQSIPWTGGFQRFLAPQTTTPQRTLVKAAWDDRCLYIAFRVYDTNPWATKTSRDDSLWEEQVVEVYIDENDDLLNYKEFEINPLGTVIDLLIPKAGDQADWRKCARWNAARWRTAVRVHADAVPRFWEAEMAFPWAIFSEATHRPPQVGDVWRIQFYRIERPRPAAGAAASDAGLVASCWSPTPNFHVPQYFGRLEFANDAQEATSPQSLLRPLDFARGKRGKRASEPRDAESAENAGPAGYLDLDEIVLGGGLGEVGGQGETPLELGAAHELDDAVHRRLGKALRDDLVRAELEIHESVEDAVGVIIGHAHLAFVGLPTP
jgi:hypothetical protein